MTEVVDRIVVGAGSAGATLAARLTEDPGQRVLLVEAGSVEPDRRADQLTNVTFALTARDWGLQAHATPDRVLAYPQGRAAGGGSAVNGALALRGLPDDFDGWVRAGCRGWGWDDLLPCLRRLEDDPIGPPEVHGRGGPIPVVRWERDRWTAQQRAFHDACVAVGLASVADLNDGRSRGVGPWPMNRREGLRVSTAIGYLEPTRARPNLEVRGGVLAGRVIVRQGRAVGVELVGPGGPQEVHAGEVVVAAGALQTPALLQRSGIGPADLLARLGVEVTADLPGVGADLVEHPGAFLFLLPEEGVCDLGEVQFQVGARITAPGSPVPDDLLIGMMSHWDLAATPDFRDVVGAPVIFALTCGVLLPRSRGRVTAADADPSTPPRVELNLCDDPEDVRRLVAALRLCLDMVRSEPLRDRVRGLALLDESTLDDDDALGAHIRATSAPWYHPVGTCRMGADDDPGAVVDPRLRVRGIADLRIADASVMPTIPRATINLTCIAIGERAAELLRDG